MSESEWAAAPTASDFIEDRLRANPDTSLQELKEAAAAVGLHIPPFLYGATRRKLGLPEAGAVDASAHASAADAAAADADAADANPAVLQPQPSRTKKSNSGFDFAVEVLRMTPDISFQELRARASMEGFNLMPIVYGRAKALLGLVPTKPRKSKKQKEQEAAAQQLADPMDGLSEQVTGSMNSIDKLVDTVRALDHDRRKLREVLVAIHEICDRALKNQ